MNTRKKEKILQIFIREVLKNNSRQSPPSGYFDPVKTICEIILEQSQYSQVQFANQKGQNLKENTEASTNILNRCRTFFRKNTADNQDTQSSTVSIQGQSFQAQIEPFLPDFLIRKASEQLANLPEEDGLSFFEKSMRAYIYKPIIFHQLLDHFQLWLETDALGSKNFAEFLTSKKIDLKENTFYSWLIKQDFINKLDYGNLDLGSSENLKRFVEEDKLLGTVCFCDLSGDEIKEHVHSYLKSKYKTSKIPDIFLDLFAEKKKSQKYFGKTVIIFGFYVIFFTFDSLVQFLQMNCATSKNAKDLGQWSSKDYTAYILNSFQDGINIKYPFSHYRACRLSHDNITKKIAVVLRHQEVRQENIRRDRSPVEDLKKQDIRERKRIICLEDIKNSRMLSILKGVVEKKAQMAVQPGQGETDFFSLTCIPARIEKDRLLLATKIDKDCLISDQETLNLKCRFAFDGAKDKVRYYRFETQLIATRNLGKNILGLEIILPEEYHISERQAARYRPKPGEIEGLTVWLYTDKPYGQIIARQDPFAVYPSGNEQLRILNLSSSGVRLCISNSVLKNQNHTCEINQRYIMKFFLSPDTQTGDPKGSSPENQPNNEVYLDSVVRNISPEPDENGQTTIGLQFVQEALPAAGGKLTWSEIQTSGSWHIGNWIFSRNIQSRK